MKLFIRNYTCKIGDYPPQKQVIRNINMSLTREIENTAFRIEELHKLLKHNTTTSEIPRKINDILIYGEKTPVSQLDSAWDYYARRKGVETQ